MKKRNGFYPRPRMDGAGSAVVSQAGGVLLTETLRTVGLDRALSQALSRWRKPLSVHDPAKVVCDLAVALGPGGDCLADVALLRAEPGVYGLVASDPTVSRTIDTLARDADRVLAAIDTARAAARAAAWRLAGEQAPDHGADADSPLVVDIDATLVTAHSDKQGAAGTLNAGTASTRCGPSWTTDRRAPGSRCRCSCARATPDRTPPPTTSPWPAPRCDSCRRTGAAPGRGGGC